MSKCLWRGRYHKVCMFVWAVKVCVLTQCILRSPWLGNIFSLETSSGLFRIHLNCSIKLACTVMYDWPWQMAGWSFTSVHHSEHSKNRHSPKWLFMREYNSWRALCPLAAEALTPIWVHFYTQVPVPMQMICAISALRVSVPNDLRPPEARRIVLMAVQELDRRFPDGVPKLDPIEVTINP